MMAEAITVGSRFAYQLTLESLSQIKLKYQEFCEVAKIYQLIYRHALISFVIISTTLASKHDLSMSGSY